MPSVASPTRTWTERNPHVLAARQHDAAEVGDERPDERARVGLASAT